MNANALQPLRAAIKQALEDARATRRRSSAGVITLLALSAAALSPQVRAADTYTANDETSLRTAINDANADGDASATITLTGNIALSSTTAFSALTKPITINTNGFTLVGQSGIAPAGSLSFSANTVTVTGTGALKGGNSADGTGTLTGGTALLMTNGSVRNSASITGGNGGNNPINNGGTGGIGVSVTNGAVTNDGSITGGIGGTKTAGAVGTSGAGGVGLSLTSGTLTNNGQITGGRGGDGFDRSGTGGVGALLSGGTHENNGVIRGGSSGVNLATGVAGIAGTGLDLSNGATFVNNGGALIEGGTTTSSSAAFGVRLGNGNNTLTNYGTVRGGKSSATSGTVTTLTGSGVNAAVTASQNTINNFGTIEGGPGAPAVSAVGTPFATVSLTLVNGGTLRAGLGQPNAVTFSTAAASTSILELQPGSVIEGNVSAAAVNATDTFRLGGTGEGSLDAAGIGSQYSGFAIFEKNNVSTWTLTGTTSASTPWRLLGGTLSVAQDGSLGSAASGLTFDTGTLRNTAAFTSARAVTLGASGGTFETASDLTWSGSIGGTGSLTKTGSGALILTAGNNYAGATNVNAGTLRVNGNQSTATGLTTVANGAALGGSGTIGGAVTVANGGHIAPGNSPGTLNMGALTLNAGSILDFELGAAGVAGGPLNDRINVVGNLVLDGTLNVAPSAGGTFGAGIYRLIDYTGTLTDNGLELGLMPAGSNNYVQTSITHQVNLINTQGLTLNYWDGAADPLSNGVVGGGNGTWQAGGNEYWTTADGSLNSGFASGSMAIFGGAAGTVTVDASRGDVRVSGMQFATDGYHVEGDAITLTSGLNAIRVGDGSGTAFTATIASALTGNGTLDKTDLGTLVLTGENTYSGNTRISAGTLQIGNGGTSGSIVGDVANEGVLAFNRSDTVTFGGVISGSGSLSQTGAGATTVTGVNTYTGATTITSGTLALGGAGSIAMSSGVVDEGVFDISAADSGASITTLSGSGSLVLGSKAFTLTAPTTTFAGVIDGAAGTLNKTGNGTWTLAGVGSQVGTLNVQAGALELAGGASLGVQSTTVSVGAALRTAGTLTGTAGNDSLALAGTLVGNVNFLGGDDRLLISEGANFSQAAFDGGAGVDTLELVQGGAFALPQAFATNFENLIKRGNGSLTLSGTVDEFSDSITVAEGTVQLADANLVTNELRVGQGVTLTGTGALSGNLLNSGTLSPGNSPGTIRVGGDFTQFASGTLVSQITRTGADLLDISGTATLAGTQHIQIEYGLYLDGTTQTLVKAASGITGDFDSVQMNASALMSADRQVTANAETVKFTRQRFQSITDPQSGRGRFAAWLEEQVDAGNLTPGMTDYVDSLLQQPSAQGAEALLGERSGPAPTVTQNSVSILGAGFARTVFERLTTSDSAQCVPTQQGSNDTLNCFWAHGLRQWGNASEDVRYDWTTDGGQVGMDRQISSGWTVGATFAYADTNTRDRTGGVNEGRAKLGGLYASYAPSRLNVGAMAFYSGNDNDTRRNVLIGSTPQAARAQFNDDSYGLGIRLGYRLTSDAGPLVRPFAEALYDHLDSAQFSETGGGAGNLGARIHSRDGIRGTLGLQLANNFEGYGRVFRPALDVGIAHQFGDVRSTLDLQPFSDAPAFRTYGPALDRTAYIARASLNVSLGANASVALGYGGELANDYSQHEGNLSFRVAW